VYVGNLQGTYLANIEDTSRRLVLKEGSTTLTLDKGSGKATLQQKILALEQEAG